MKKSNIENNDLSPMYFVVFDGEHPVKVELTKDRKLKMRIWSKKGKGEVFKGSLGYLFEYGLSCTKEGFDDAYNKLK